MTEMDAFSFVLYFLSACFILSILYRSLRLSEFGILLLSVEFFTVLIGLCFYPLLISFDLIVPGKEGLAYLSRNGFPGLLSAVHIFIFTATGYLGFLLATKKTYMGEGYIFRRLSALLRSPETSFKMLVASGISVYILFFYLVGFRLALMEAHAARGGHFDGFGESQKFLFLKTLANLSLYAVCFLPAILERGRLRKNRLFVVAYFILVGLAYLNSISRSLLLTYLIAPVLLYLVSRVSWTSFHKFIPVAVFGLLVLYYGKPLGFYISSVLQGYSVDLVVYNADSGVVNGVFQNAEFAWFSVAAGVDHFLRYGAIFPEDLIYSLLGFIPDRFLGSIGLSGFLYENATTRLACVNTENFGLGGCTVPPLLPGFSAYLFPAIGGGVAGFLKYFLLGRIEMIWIFSRRTDYRLTWIPYMLFLFVSSLFSFIPAAIAPVVLVIIFLFVLMAFRRLFLLRSQVHL